MAVGFSIGSKGYIGTGYDNSGYTKDFWEYDPDADAWTQKANFGGTARYLAVGFSIGSKGYIGTGWDGGNYKDFWEYDPATNAWRQKADFGGTARRGAVGFSIGSKGYIGTGADANSNKNDFWEYDPAINVWTQKVGLAGGERYGAVGFSIGSKGYIGTGVDITYIFKNDFWEYDPATDTWTQKADFVGTARDGAVGFSIGSKGYIGTGNNSGTFYNDFWEYDPATNTWTQKADFGGTAREWAVGFSIGSKGYIGTGSHTKDFWEYTPKCNGLTVYADADGDSYGNAANSLFVEDCIVPSGYVLDSTDCDDTDASVHPNATEVCNGIDENCDETIDNIIAAITPGGIVTICNRDSVVLTANSGAGMYHWIKETHDIPGATNQTYIAKKEGHYRVRETGFSCNATSDPTNLMVNYPPKAYISHGSLDLCGQASVLLTANAGTAYTYQWKARNRNISGATNQTYSAIVVGTYRVVVTNSYGCSRTSKGVQVIKSCKESSFASIETVAMFLYPNPAKDQTTIHFTLTQSAHVSVKVYDLSGKEITTLLNEYTEQGIHSLQFNTYHFAKGVYLVKMITDSGIVRRTPYGENQKLIVQ